MNTREQLMRIVQSEEAFQAFGVEVAKGFAKAVWLGFFIGIIVGSVLTYLIVH